jgi:hypothetical protein
LSRVDNHYTNSTRMYIGRVFFLICTILILCSNSSFQNIYAKTSERVTIHDLLPFDPATSEKSPTTGNSAETAYAANLAILQKITGGIKNTGAKNNKTDTFAAQNLSSIVSFNQENATKKVLTRGILVRATNMTAVSVLLDKALKAGASVDRIQFGLSEDKVDEQRVNVMELALGDAWKKARDAATLLDVRVVGIKSLSIDDLSFGNEAQFPISSTTSFGASLIPSSVDLVMNVTQSFLFKERS